MVVTSYATLADDDAPVPSRTIGSPGLQPNAFANASMFDGVPTARNIEGAWGSVTSRTAASSFHRPSGRAYPWWPDQCVGGHRQPTEIGDVLAEGELAVDLLA